MENVRRLLMVIVVSLIIVFSGVYLSIAADSKEEYEVYNNFIIVTGAEAQYNQMIDIMMSQFQQGFSTGVQDAIKNKDNISEKDKTEIQKIINESMNSFMQKLKEKLLEKMPFQELVKNVYMPVYQKYFTIDEIKEITKFYESRTGSKFVSLVPAIMQEEVTVFNQSYNEKVMQISKEIAEIEFSKMKQAIEQLEKQ
jgi:hypothetical protein